MSIFGIFKKNDNNEEINQYYVEDEVIPNDEDGLDLTDNVQEDVITVSENQEDPAIEATDQSNNDGVKQTDPNVDKVSGHNNNDVQYFMDKNTDLSQVVSHLAQRFEDAYFMDKNTDLSQVVSHLAQRFEDAGYDVDVNHVDTKGDQYYHIEARKTESSASILIEVNNELAGAVRNIDDHIESTAFDPTNDDEITNILQVWNN